VTPSLAAQAASDGVDPRRWFAATPQEGASPFDPARGAGRAPSNPGICPTSDARKFCSQMAANQFFSYGLRMRWFVH